MSYPADLNAGLRFESTTVDSRTVQALPTGFVWQGNNDWTITTGSETTLITDKGKYDNVLPNLDLAVHLRDDLIARGSFSTTIARPALGNLLSAITYNTPNDPTALGAIATGTTGDAGLLPLNSQNTDLTLEWYYGKNSYIAGGFYHKTVNNFIGVGQYNSSLFGLRDPSSGKDGTRSGDAKAAVTSLAANMSDSNLFAMTALISHYESIGQARATAIQSAKNDFSSHLVNGDLDNAYYVSIENAYDLTGNSDDPLFDFTITKPINNRQAEIYGFEISGQHFFGDSGFGAAYSLTTVNGNVGFDNGADPSKDQFALVGLSNTYNVTAIYDKYGWSGRLTYNWRDRYLASVNKGDGYRNPVYVAPFGQLDLAVDYQVTPAVTLSFQGSNLTKEHLRQYGRTEVQVFFDQELDTRYQMGLRYKF
jgi:TonB-dependent receptor